MAVNPMLASGVSGISQGVKALDRIAQDIAELNVHRGNPSTQEGQPTPLGGLDDVAEAMLDLKLYQRDVQAAAKAVQTADEVIGFLLDVHA